MQYNYSERSHIASKPIWTTRLSEEKSLDGQDSGVMPLPSYSSVQDRHDSSVPKTDLSTPTVNFSPNDQHFSQNDENVAKRIDFDDHAKPEKGILSKPKPMPKRMNNVVNEVFIDKRPKFKRQESIISGFDIEGIQEEEERVSPSPAGATAFENPTFIDMDGQ